MKNSLFLAVQEYRNQLLNRQLALMKFISIIKDGLKKPFKIGKSTKTTKASQKKELRLRKNVAN